MHCSRAGNAATVQHRVCWGKRYELVCGSLKFWRHFWKYTCHCTSDNLFLSSCLSVITKPALWSQGQCVQEEHIPHTWWRLLEMWLPADPSPFYFCDIQGMVGGRWLGPTKVCGSGKYILNSEAAGNIWSLVVNRPTPRPGLTTQYITNGSFTVFTRNQKPDLNWSMPVSGSELGEQPGWGNNFNKNAITKAYKAVSKLLGDTERSGEKVQGSKVVPRIVWRMEKGPFGWSYHWVAVSPVITFMVCDLWALQRCRGCDRNTEILADMQNEWKQVVVKAPEERTE